MTSRRSFLLRLGACIGLGAGIKAVLPKSQPAVDSGLAAIWAKHFERVAKQQDFFSCLDGAAGEDGHAVIIGYCPGPTQWGTYRYQVIDEAAPLRIKG